MWTTNGLIGGGGGGGVRVGGREGEGGLILVAILKLQTQLNDL